MSKYGVYFFSGTGNSLWSAKRIAHTLEDSKVYSISQKMNAYYREKDKALLRVDEEVMILVYPAYAYESPSMVRKFVQRATISSKRIIAVVTCGSSPGGALAEIKRLLMRKKLKLSYADSIKCVENYIPIFGATAADEMAAELAFQAEKTDMIAKNIQSSAENDIFAYRVLSGLVSKTFRLAKPLIVSFYKVGKNCNGCGICEKVCPAKAIVMSESKSGKKPRFKKLKCEQCMACFNYCPKKATSLFRLRQGSHRYNHPELPLNEYLEYINKE